MKREEKKLAYREKHAEEAMLDICSKHMMLGANAVVKDGYRNGFADGECSFNDGHCTIKYHNEYEVLGNIFDNPELLKSL